LVNVFGLLIIIIAVQITHLYHLPAAVIVDKHTAHATQRRVTHEVPEKRKIFQKKKKKECCKPI
jgi:uncharacterized membrane protein (DUF106 family)